MNTARIPRAIRFGLLSALCSMAVGTAALFAPCAALAAAPQPQWFPQVLPPTPGASAPASSPSDEEAKAIAAFTERYKAQQPGTRIDSVTVSPIKGLFQVVMGKNVAYVEPSGRYALFGHIWDMEARRDLTADVKVAVDRINVDSLPKALAVRHVRGRGTRSLYVFADPQCGYCKQLEQTLQAVDDVTVYTFIVPILGPESRRLATAIACAADPAASWSAWMLRAQSPASPQASCEAAATAVPAVEKLAQAVNVVGTPTLVAGDGRKNAGALTLTALNAWLAESTSSASAADKDQARQGNARLAAAGAPTPKSTPR